MAIDPGLFLETSNLFDTRTLYDMDPSSIEFKEFLVKLTKTVDRITRALNLKETGIYAETEFVCGNVYPHNPALSLTTPQIATKRNSFRKFYVITTALPNPGITPNPLVIPHGITIDNNWSLLHIYGATNDQINHLYRPLGYPSTAALPIEIWVDDTNIYIRTLNNCSNYTLTYLCLEYLKY
jgi:hypothetical protein